MTYEEAIKWLGKQPHHFSTIEEAELDQECRAIINEALTVSADDIQFGVDKIPTVDAVPVVRCENCANRGEHDSELPMVYCHAFERWVHEEFYCESGAKMDKE